MTRHMVGPGEDIKENGMIFFWSYFEKKLLLCVCTCVLGACAQPCVNLWKPQVATEYPFTLHIIFKARSFTESGGQQLYLTADQQDPGVVLSPRDSIWHTVTPGFLTGCWRSDFRASGFLGKHFPHGSIWIAPRSCFLQGRPGLRAWR